MALDRKFAKMVRRLNSSEFEIVGLPNGQISPRFRWRDEAEIWLDNEVPKLGLDRSKRGPRACLCCGHGFESEGIHNRMCGSCRLLASQDQDVPFSFGAIHGRKRLA
jgi:hypothetical protein